MTTNLFKSPEERNEWILLYAKFVVESSSILRTKKLCLLEAMTEADTKLKYFEDINKLEVTLEDLKVKDYKELQIIFNKIMWDQLADVICKMGIDLNKVRLMK